MPSQRIFGPVMWKTAPDKTYARINRHGEIQLDHHGVADWGYMSTSQRKVRNSVRVGPLFSAMAY